MKLRRLAYGFSTLVVSLSSLFVLASPVAHAASVTWTGTAGDGLFSSASNWSSNSVPVTGDDITFDITGLASNTTVTDDLGSSVQFSGVTVMGTNASGFSYTIASSGATPELDVTGTIQGGVNGLTLDTNVTTGGPITINGGVTIQTGRHLNLGGDVSVLGQLYVDGDLTGAGNINVTSNGYLVLSVANSWTGNVTVAADGIVAAQNANSLGNAANILTLQDGGVLSTCGINSGIIPQALVLTGYSSSGGQADYGTLQAYGSCGGAGAPVTGSVPQANVTFSGDVTLNGDVKVGSAGVMKFTGANATGAHTITILDGQSGSLQLAFGTNGISTANATYQSAPLVTTYSANSPSTIINVGYNEIATVSGTYGDVTVNGGTLKGSGTVGIVTLNSGTVAPGNSPGVLNTGNLVFTGGSLAEEIGGTATGQYDQLNVTGTVDLGSATVLNVTQWNGYVPAAGDTFVIIKNDGADAVTGTFQGLAEGATVTAGTVTYTISYKGGDGNDVVLTATGVAAVAAPNTGFEHFSNNPLATLLTTIGIVTVVSLIARRKLKADK